MWMVVILSSLFLSTFCLDLASDDIELETAFVFPGVAFVFTIALFLLVRYKILTARRFGPILTCFSYLDNLILGKMVVLAAVSTTATVATSNSADWKEDGVKFLELLERNTSSTLETETNADKDESKVGHMCQYQNSETKNPILMQA